jgi:hypothetical protein
MPGQPKKTRAEREAELRHLLTLPGGRYKLSELLREALGLPEGTMPGAGKPMIQTILNNQYPNG